MEKIYNDIEKTTSTGIKIKDLNNGIYIEGVGKQIEIDKENNSIIFDNPSFNSSIIGVSTDGRVVYDYNKMIKELSEEANMSVEEAAEFIEYNTIGSLPSSSLYFPIVIYKSEDII